MAKKLKKTHKLVHSKLFFVSLSVHAIGKTDSAKMSVLMIKMIR